MEAGKKRLAGDTLRSATTDEVKDLRREACDQKEVVAEQTLELRILKKNMIEGSDRRKPAITLIYSRTVVQPLLKAQEN